MVGDARYFTVDDLELAGTICFGFHWMKPMGKALNCGDRVIRYYLAGRPLPDDMGRRVLRVIADREAEIRKLRLRLFPEST